MLLSCPICMVGFEEFSDISCLPCGHLYHGACVREWLHRNNACPQCRTPTTTATCIKVYPQVSEEGDEEADNQFDRVLDNVEKSIATLDKHVRTLRQTNLTLVTENRALQDEIDSLRAFARAEENPNRMVWRRASRGEFPDNAFRAGYDGCGTTYVCRANHEGDLLPGRLVPNLGKAFICHDGWECTESRYEVLCGYDFYWTPMPKGGPIPDLAVVGGGIAKDGQDLFIGRVKINNCDVIGKVHPSQLKCYVPYEELEREYSEFEILMISE